MPIINSSGCKKYVDGAFRAINPVKVVETEARAIWLDEAEQKNSSYAFLCGLFRVCWDWRPFVSRNE